jgi:hypothetical protein
VLCNWHRLFFILALTSAARAAARDTVEIPFEDREGLLWIHATIGDTNRVNLLLDTGAGASVINRSTADRLGLKRGAAVNVRGVSTMLTGYQLRGVTARAGDVPLPANYITVDLRKLSVSCQEPVDGLLGADFFCERAVELDFKERKLRILADTPDHSNADTIPMELRPCGMRVPITVNGHKQQWVRLDTGCATPLQWVTSKVKATDCNPKVAIGLTEVSIPQAETTVEIGRQRFESIPTGLHEQPIFAGESGLLGNGLLSRFSRVTIDAKARRVILEP